MVKVINFLNHKKNIQSHPEKTPEYNVWGSGVESCQEVITNYDKGPEGVRTYYDQYIVGAIMGMMVALEETSTIDNGDDLVGQTLYYCRECPAEPLYWAITQTTNLLRGLPAGISADK